MGGLKEDETDGRSVHSSTEPGSEGRRKTGEEEPINTGEGRDTTTDDVKIEDGSKRRLGGWTQRRTDKV